MVDKLVVTSREWGLGEHQVGEWEVQRLGVLYMRDTANILDNWKCRVV